MKSLQLTLSCFTTRRGDICKLLQERRSEVLYSYDLSANTIAITHNYSYRKMAYLLRIKLDAAVGILLGDQKVLYPQC